MITDAVFIHGVATQLLGGGAYQVVGVITVYRDITESWILRVRAGPTIGIRVSIDVEVGLFVVGPIAVVIKSIALIPTMSRVQNLPPADPGPQHHGTVALSLLIEGSLGPGLSFARTPGGRAGTPLKPCAALPKRQVGGLSAQGCDRMSPVVHYPKQTGALRSRRAGAPFIDMSVTIIVHKIGGNLIDGSAGTLTLKGVMPVDASQNAQTASAEARKIPELRKKLCARHVLNARTSFVDHPVTVIIISIPALLVEVGIAQSATSFFIVAVAEGAVGAPLKPIVIPVAVALPQIELRSKLNITLKGEQHGFSGDGVDLVGLKSLGEHKELSLKHPGGTEDQNIRLGG